jgi:hypothetical protein
MKTKSRKRRQLEPPLKPGRVTEVLLHAYNYVRGLDPAGKSGAADLLWCKYQEVKQKQR